MILSEFLQRGCVTVRESFLSDLHNFGDAADLVVRGVLDVDGGAVIALPQ